MAEPEPQPPQPLPGLDQKGRVQSTRISGVWIGLIVAAVCLLLLVIFIAQNSARTSVHFFRLNGHMSLALIILLAAVIGLLVAAVPGSIRIMQLRKALKQQKAAAAARELAAK
jgi:uncharacterized integral membrane protein